MTFFFCFSFLFLSVLAGCAPPHQTAPSSWEASLPRPPTRGAPPPLGRPVKAWIVHQLPYIFSLFLFFRRFQEIGFVALIILDAFLSPGDEHLSSLCQDNFRIGMPWHDASLLKRVFSPNVSFSFLLAGNVSTVCNMCLMFAFFKI